MLALPSNLCLSSMVPLTRMRLEVAIVNRSFIVIRLARVLPLHAFIVDLISYLLYINILGLPT